MDLLLTDERLMVIADQQIGWILDKAESSHEAARLALLSVLMRVRDDAAHATVTAQECEGCAKGWRRSKTAPNAYFHWKPEGTTERQVTCTATRERRATLPDLEVVAAEVHRAWIDSKLKQGVTTRQSEAGEELMVPYPNLSEAAKELDRGSVRAVYAAIERAQPSETKESA
jgi:hypothetical protein